MRNFRDRDLTREGSLGAVLIFFGAFAVYAFCAYPAIAPRDGADLAAAALSLGVAHPPGYPLYVLLGKAWLIVFRLGNPAYRLNILSALIGAGAATGAFLLMRPRGGLVPARGAAMGLAFSAGLWKFSLLEEKYALHAVFIVGLMGLSQGRRESLLRRAALSGLVLGLGLVNHQSLILLSPALIHLWRAEAKRHQYQDQGLVLTCYGLAFLVLGLALELFVWVRLGDARLAWSVATRAEYGSLELYGGFARPFSLPLAWDIMGHLARGLWTGSGGVLVLSALAGGFEAVRRRDDFGVGVLIALAAFGPLFFLMTRFDLSGWVAQSALEPAFIAPALCLSLLAALGLARLQSSAPRLAVALSLAAGFLPLWRNFPAMNHREDFSAYDYAMDLRRELPPGSAAVAGGDTALFSLRYFELLYPREPGRVLVSSRENDLRGWIDRQARVRPVFVLGLPLDALGSLGLLGNPRFVRPEGLVQRIVSKLDSRWSREEAAAWELSAPRQAPAAASGDSYSHDIRLAYAFSHYLSGRLYEGFKLGDPTGHYAKAASIDPEDYRVSLAPER